MEIINCNTFDKILVRVQRGDTMQSIAQTYNTNVCNILRNNPNIDLYEGEMVKIVRNNKNTHIVKPMETLELIANQYDITVDKLVKINNLKSNRLFIGQMLQIE